MNLKLIAAALTTTILLAPTTARAEWVRVGSSYNTVFYIEDSTIEDRGNTVSFWQRDVLDQPFKGRAKSVVNHYAVSCSNNTTTTIESIFYTRSGKKLNDPAIFSTPGFVITNIPGTVAYDIQQLVCSN